MLQVQLMLEQQELSLQLAGSCLPSSIDNHAPDTAWLQHQSQRAVPQLNKEARKIYFIITNIYNGANMGFLKTPKWKSKNKKLPTKQK